MGSVELAKTKQTLPVTINCYPWKLKNEKTVVARDDLGTAYKQLTLSNERRAVIPLITIAQDTTLLWSGTTIAASAGENLIFPAIRLAAGTNILKAKVDSGTGSITVTYQEASL